MQPNEWGDPANRPTNGAGSKARIGQSKNSYSDWHRTLGHGCYASDVDWIECRKVGDTLAPVAIIETTFYDDKPELRHLLPRYREAALARFKRDAQYRIALLVAQALGVAAYFVLVRKDVEHFIVVRLVDEFWCEMTEPEYRAWITEL